VGLKASDKTLDICLDITSNPLVSLRSSHPVKIPILEVIYVETEHADKFSHRPVSFAMMRKSQIYHLEIVLDDTGQTVLKQVGLTTTSLESQAANKTIKESPVEILTL
jgi:hypothetical protein